LTIDQIAERLALPRTTVFYWVRDLPVNREDFDPRRMSEARARAARANSLRHAALRRTAYERGLREYDERCREPMFRDFVCLYIGEGLKRSRHRVAIGNSDPAVIALSLRMIEGLTTNKVGFDLQYHADQDPGELAGFWADRLGIAADRIRLQRKSNSNALTGRTWRSQYGVLTVTVGDTYLRARVQAWMDRIRASWTYTRSLGA
jgi:hypothetical protein